MLEAAFWSEDRVVRKGVPPGRLSFTFEHMSYVFALVLVEVNNGDQPVSVSLVLFHHPVSVELAKLDRIIRCQVAFVAQVVLRGVAPVI